MDKQQMLEAMTRTMNSKFIFDSVDEINPQRFIEEFNSNLNDKGKVFPELKLTEDYFEVR